MNARIKYKSKFEKRIAALLRRAKVKFKYEKTSYKYQSRVRAAARCSKCGSNEIYVRRSYTPDFFLENGVIIETKGKWTTADRYKMLDVRTSNPTLKVYMLFMSDNKISKASKTRYSDFCIANGFTYAIREPEKGWLSR